MAIAKMEWQKGVGVKRVRESKVAVSQEAKGLAALLSEHLFNFPEPEQQAMHGRAEQRLKKAHVSSAKA
jgi:hypothetical protein